VTWRRCQLRFALAALLMLPFVCRAGPMDDAEQAYLRREYATAIGAYRQALTHDISEQNRAKCWYMLGQSHLMSGNNSKAREAFQQILVRYAKTDWLAPAYVGLGDAYYHERKFAAALTAYKNSMTERYLRQYGSAVYYRLARTHRAQKDATLAARYETIIRTKYPDSLEARLLLTGAAVPRPSTASRAGAVRYSVQLAFTPRADFAQDYATRLKKKGYDAFVVAGTVKGAAGYRVLVGRYQGREAADAQCRKISAAEKITCFVTTL